MTKRMPPGADMNFDAFSIESQEHHEEIVDLFGRYVMWMRNWTNESARRLVNSSDAREQLSTIFRRPYEEVARLSPNDRDCALQLAESSVDAFIILLLQTLSHRGMDFPLGNRHAIRYRLEMEIVDQETGEIVQDEIVNRNGKKHFADYWGRWFNRHRNT